MRGGATKSLGSASASANASSLGADGSSRGVGGKGLVEGNREGGRGEDISAGPSDWIGVCGRGSGEVGGGRVAEGGPFGVWDLGVVMVVQDPHQTKVDVVVERQLWVGRVGHGVQHGQDGGEAVVGLPMARG